MASKYSNITFKGYRRENGRVGVRNHVLILPVDDISNAACEAVANNVKGTLAIPHAYGRLQFGEDLELHFRTMIGTGANPNVPPVVVIGIEPGWTKRIADGIRETGKPVAGVLHRAEGRFRDDPRRLLGREGVRPPRLGMQREECSISELWVSTKCGESDTTTGLGSCPTVGNMYDKLLPEGITGFFGETSEITGAEHICQKRAINEEVGERWYKMWKAYQDDVIFAHQTDDLSDSQPTKGNIEGGLTTIEEKALGNLEKIGRTSQYIDILEPAEAPKSGNGLYFMDSVFGGGGMRDADGRGRGGGPHLPHRAGQCGRQPHRAGHQDHRQPAHGAHHGRACGRRRVGHSAPRDDHRRGRRRADRHDPPHRQWPQHRAPKRWVTGNSR
jgi:(2R)-sulfolactate sulfo-lyase subunit beta